MSVIFSLIWLVTLIAFIVFWRKKAKAKKAAGATYETDENYLSVSKTKRTIGIICAASFVLSIFFADTTEKPATENKPAITTENKPAQEKNFLGQWYSVKKDSAGNIAGIILLDITSEKAAKMEVYELTANKFSATDSVKLLWRYGSLNVNLSRSGKNLTFSIKVPTVSGEEDMTISECKFDADAQKLISNEDTFTRDAVDVQNLKNTALQQQKNNFENQGETVEILADMHETEYNDFINKQVFGM